MNGRTNLFFALWPNDSTREALSQLQTLVRGQLTCYQNLHLTLAFLGPHHPSSLPALRALISELDDTPINLKIDHLGYFKRNRVTWAGTHEAPSSLTQVQHQLAALLEQQQIQFDRKYFKPHITLARHAEPPSDYSFEPFIWHVNQIVLAQSPIPNEPPGYKVLASKSLKIDY